MLTFLEARGVEVPEDARQRITECTDLDQLETWIRRAATVTSVEELFDSRPGPGYRCPPWGSAERAF